MPATMSNVCYIHVCMCAMECATGLLNYVYLKLNLCVVSSSVYDICAQHCIRFYTVLSCHYVQISYDCTMYNKPNCTAQTGVFSTLWHVF